MPHPLTSGGTGHGAIVADRSRSSLCELQRRTGRTKALLSQFGPHIVLTIWVIRRGDLNRTGDRFMGRTQGSNRHRAQALPKVRIKTRNEIEELREENRQLRELVAHLSKLALERITETAEPREQSTVSQKITNP